MTKLQSGQAATMLQQLIAEADNKNVVFSDDLSTQTREQHLQGLVACHEDDVLHKNWLSELLVCIILLRCAVRCCTEVQDQGERYTKTSRTWTNTSSNAALNFQLFNFICLVFCDIMLCCKCLPNSFFLSWWFYEYMR